MTVADADFIVALLNDPAFIRFIGDRGIRTADDARAYVEHGPAAMYERHGVGLLVVELRESGAAIGICGLLQRDTLADVDLGFAFLPAFRGMGFAREAAQATIDDATHRLGIHRIAAIVNPDNAISLRMLHDLGFSFERRLRLTADAPEVELLVRTTADQGAGMNTTHTTDTADTADIPPALSREEWAGVLANRAQLDAIRDQFLDTPFDGHAVAALLLFEQPFGFTTQDVDDEVQVSAYCVAMANEQESRGNASAAGIFRELGERHRGRAARIASLLPPAEPATSDAAAPPEVPVG